MTTKKKEFERIFHYTYDQSLKKEKEILSDSKQNRCRLCGLDETMTDFRNECHVIPAGLGNRSLFTSAECDKCNEKYGQIGEDSLIKFLSISRIFSFGRKRKGLPKYRFSHKSPSSISLKPHCNEVEIAVHLEDDSITMDMDETAKTVTLQYKVPSIDFVNVCKSLTHSALLAMPEDIFLKYKYLTKWLSNEEKYLPTFYEGFIPRGFGRTVTFTIYETGLDDFHDMDLWIILIYGHNILLLPTPKQNFNQPSVLDLPPLPNIPIWALSLYQLEIISEGKIPSHLRSITFKYDDAIKLKDTVKSDTTINESLKKIDTNLSEDMGKFIKFRKISLNIPVIVELIPESNTPIQIEMSVKCGTEDINEINICNNDMGILGKVDLKTGKLTYSIDTVEGKKLEDIRSLILFLSGMQGEFIFCIKDKLSNKEIINVKSKVDNFVELSENILYEKQILETLEILREYFKKDIRYTNQVTEDDFYKIWIYANLIQKGFLEIKTTNRFQFVFNRKGLNILKEFRSNQNAKSFNIFVELPIQIKEYDLNLGSIKMSFIEPSFEPKINEIIKSFETDVSLVSQPVVIESNTLMFKMLEISE